MGPFQWPSRLSLFLIVGGITSNDASDSTDGIDERLKHHSRDHSASSFWGFKRGQWEPCPESHECAHGATCVATLADGNTYCDCATINQNGNGDSYAGRYCDYVATSYCSKKKEYFCTNGGTCEVSHSIYSNATSNMNAINNTASNITDNEETHLDLEDEDNQWKCNCPDGYFGKRCEYNYIHDRCTLDCNDNGLCLIADDGKMECTCLPGFTGAFCELLENLTMPSEEVNGQDQQKNETISEEWEMCPSDLDNAPPDLCVGYVIYPDPFSSYCNCTTLPPYYEPIFPFQGYCCKYLSSGDDDQIQMIEDDDQFIDDVMDGDECLVVCYNGGVCKIIDESSVCRCPVGYSGILCEHSDSVSSDDDFSMSEELLLERENLQKFFDATRGPRWDRNINWLSNNTQCFWYGVRCNSDNRVVSIVLSDNNLQSVIDSPWKTLADLKYLKILILDRNSLEGPLLHLTSFPIIERLDLGNNRLSGSLTDDILSLKNLRTLKLNSNSLGGSIPASISGLHRIEELDLSSNRLRGSIPTLIGNLTFLEVLDVSSNAISGKLNEPYLRRLTNLTSLLLSDNEFSGTLPQLDGYFYPKLSRVDLSWNSFEGTIPFNLLVNSTMSMELDISYNKIEGIFPYLNIEYLSVNASANYITGIHRRACGMVNWNDGAIDEFGCDGLLCESGSYNVFGRQTSADFPCLSCPSAEYWGATECSSVPSTSPTIPSPTSFPPVTADIYPAGDERNILAEFYQATNGRYWANNMYWLSQDPDIGKCYWYGIVCNKNAQVEAIELSHNGLTGGGGPWNTLEGLASLRKLVLNDNNISGPLMNLASIHQLEELNLGGNNLSGPLQEMKEFPSIRVLDLGRNQITGEIPFFIDEIFYSVTRLILGRNKMTGFVPNHIGNLKHLEVLDISHNQFSGIFPFLSLHNIENLTTIQVSHNNLEGSLPLFDGNFYPKLSYINLSWNDMTGIIPYDLFVNSTVETMNLDIRHNNFAPIFPDIDVERLNIEAAGNPIFRLDPSACLRQEWNNGQVGEFGCDAILCRRLTYNRMGRQSSVDSPCVPCLSAVHYGTTECEDVPTPQPTMYFTETTLPTLVPNVGDFIDCPNSNMQCRYPAKCFELTADTISVGGHFMYSRDVWNNTVCDCRHSYDGRIAYAGLSCEFEATSFCTIDGEASPDNFCTNGGECVRRVRESEHHPGCICGEGFDGPRCEIVVDGPSPPPYWPVDVCPLENHICVNGGACVPSLNDPESMYICNCSASFRAERDDEHAYTGDYCQYPATDWCTTDLSPSTVLFCANGGVCNRLVDHGMAHPGCECPEPFMGLQCEETFSSPTKKPSSISYDSTQYEVLVAFYEATTGNLWYYNNDWLSEEVDVCFWYGVVCTEENIVSKLLLPSNYLRGLLPNDLLALLPNLTTIDFSNNYLEGEITKSLASLASLKSLDLSFNDLKGFIPTTLGWMTTLEELNLQGNEFYGFEAYEGFLNLRILNLRDNNISGTLPRHITKTERLEILALSGNSFHGTLSHDYSLLVNLTEFDVSSNSIHGPLPGYPFLSTNANLQILNVSHNNLRGEIPTDLMQDSLSMAPYDIPRYIDLSFNLFEGEVPAFERKVLNISVVGNALKGIQSCDYEEWNGDDVLTFGCDGIACPVGTANAEGRQSSKSFPCEPCSTAWYIGTVGCANDSYEPTPPPSNYWGYTPTSAAPNNWGYRPTPPPSSYWGFTPTPTRPPNYWGYRPTPPPSSYWGFTPTPTPPPNYWSYRPTPFPTSWNNPTTQFLINLYFLTDGDNWRNNQNWLSDRPICQWYGVGCNNDFVVTNIWLGSNSLDGEINFEFKETIPSLVTIDLSNNTLKGTISETIANIYNLESLDLSANFFRGSFPVRFSRLNNLQVLNIANNELTGSLPDLFHRLQNLVEIDLSENDFSGELPSVPGFSQNSELQLLNVSYNVFSGEIPSNIMLASFEASIFSNEPRNIDLSWNKFIGTVPYFEAKLLNLNVTGNELEYIDERNCDNLELNQGSVSRYGCDAIACAVGTANAEGRQVSDSNPCQPCPESVYIGSVGCQESNFPDNKCPSNHNCQNGATCKINETSTLGYTCDCKSATTTWFEVYAGRFCEFEATQFCSDLHHVAVYAFCTNGGTCNGTNISPGESHPGCSCAGEYFGDHCEMVIMSPTAQPSTSPTLDPTSNPTSSPIILPDTFSLYEIPPFIFAILVNDNSDIPAVTSPSTLLEIEGATSDFLSDTFARSLDVANSVYIATIKATSIDYDDLLENVTAVTGPNANRNRQLQEGDNLALMRFSGIISIRDGIFDETEINKSFIPSTMNRAFQSRDVLAASIRNSLNPALQFVSSIELTSTMKICPNGLRCHHGSQCLGHPIEPDRFVCDCESASSKEFEVFDGLQCEYAATQFCSDSSDVGVYSYCMNQGNCTRDNIELGEAHPGCWCPSSFEGPHCQFAKELTPPDTQSTAQQNQENNSLPRVGLGAGGFVVILLVATGFLL